MAVAFAPGQTLGRSDLHVFLTNASDAPSNAYEIFYSIHFVSPGTPETETLIGNPARIPVNPSIGEYFASLQVPSTAPAGTYRIRWNFREFSDSQMVQVVQPWAVVVPGSVLSAPAHSAGEIDLLRSIRILLRDQNPGRNYHFRPPEREGNIGRYNRVFGQVWEDDELLEFLRMGLDWWNMFPPMTPDTNSLDLLVRSRPYWRTAILWDAVSRACFALSANWVVDEFDYSIGGVSLSVEKSSKYESLKNSAEGQFDKATEAKARTVKIIRGLQQPKFGVGIRSAFGPYSARGIMSPRSFV